MGIFREIRLSQKEEALVTFPTESYQEMPHTVIDVEKQSDTSTTNQNNTVTILICVSAGVAVLIVAIILLCLFLVKRRRLRRKKIASKYDKVFTTPRRNSPFSSSSATSSITSRDQSRTTYNALDVVSTQPQIENTELDIKTTHNERLARYRSFEENSDRKMAKPLKKSKSAAAIITNGCQSEQDCNTLISFHLKYVSKLRQLHLKLLGAADLPVKTFGYDINATVYLFPRNTEGVHSRSVKGSRDIQLTETFFFDDMTMTEVEKATLRIVLNYKKKGKVAKETFLGELFVKCCDVDWTAEQPIKFTSPLMKTRERIGSTVDKYLLEELGSLFLCVEYQITANRMKVMVRKGTNFPKSDKLIGRPGHYVVISLIKNTEIVKTQDTKCQNGYSPVWNQPFLFDVSGNDINDYSLDFVIMREKLHTKNAIVGHVHIGTSGSKSGRLHWKEITSPRPTQTARWHSILPVINFKDCSQGE